MCGIGKVISLKFRVNETYDDETEMSESRYGDIRDLDYNPATCLSLIKLLLLPPCC